jgi:predicted alpha/beta-fold hydrolase
MDYQSIYLHTPDGEFIHAYWIYQIENVDSTMTILYLHGAGGNISHRLEVLRLFYENLNCNILIIDYRGLSLIENIQRLTFFSFYQALVKVQDLHRNLAFISMLKQLMII